MSERSEFMLERRREVLLWELRVSVGRAVMAVLTETTDVGVPERGRYIEMPDLIVSCEGRDFRVWISKPDTDIMDSCEVERRSVGRKGELHMSIGGSADDR